ncbi:hypothetical protein BU14_0785s0003 [Porphyra umbilicalis]|uniref:Peptidyl-prolyl cis-trans isomerase n=1 Tax=Porphyra umbilicalis TaxID=2786 RepID=A0A1X6NPA4_PORUM|nr:hypothetical protein BU14_0785s0003 [Porphyra umbilicalis]|eukprot:OSX70326.1 hypothetical protein BU14_0785s0003 [Porphyra umbilicalis]
MSVLIETSLGDLVIDVDTVHAPVTAANFLALCHLKYYNNCTFHRVERDFIAQTGDPTRTGTGGSSVYGLCAPPAAGGAAAAAGAAAATAAPPPPRFFADEFHPSLKHSRRGVVAMAPAGGPHTNGSQFYIQLAAGPLPYLDGVNPVFGFVAEGAAVLDALNDAVVDAGTLKPLRRIRVHHTIVGLDSDMDEAALVAGAADGTAAAARQARSRAVVLELVGDMPSADAAPPEDVLFVCKLNPLTRGADLALIFARFGPCTAQVIRDGATGASLGYAFVEFESVASCEAAYRKMDGVLIDDRRVKVDFSQSVARLWRGRGRGRGGGEARGGGGRGGGSSRAAGR